MIAVLRSEGALVPLLLVRDAGQTFLGALKSWPDGKRLTEIVERFTGFAGGFVGLCAPTQGDRILGPGGEAWAIIYGPRNGPKAR